MAQENITASGGRAEGRGQRTEGGGQRAEDRGQRTEDGGRSEKDEHRGKRRLRHRTSNVQVSEDSDIEWEGTEDGRPLCLICYEACLRQEDALKRERYFKTYNGKRFLHNRLKSYLTG